MRGLWRWWAAAASVLAAGALAPGAGAAALRWSGPLPIDHRAGVTLTALACPSAQECVALDSFGRVVTYDPVSPGDPRAVVIAGDGLAAIACPGVAQCTGVTAAGVAFTFDPRAPGAPAGRAIDAFPRNQVGGESNDAITGLSCPAMTQCTAVDSTGREVTFDPTSSAAPSAAGLESGQDAGLASVACVSLTQCTALGGARAVTFDPAAPADAASAQVVRSGFFGPLACPAATECVAVDQNGREITFNPQALAPSTPATVDHEEFNPLEGLACPSVSRCVAVSQGGREVTFDPGAPAAAAARLIDRSAGGGVVGQETGLMAVACPAFDACSAVDGNGRTLTFDPAAPGLPIAHRIDAGSPLLALDCAARAECTTVGQSEEVTFDPFTPTRPRAQRIFSDIGIGIDGIACSRAASCTAVRSDQEVTFDPRRVHRRPRPRTIDPNSDEGIVDVVCPARSECVEVDANGWGVTYDPRTGRVTRREFDIEYGESLTGLACASPRQCTAIDNNGTMLTFNPRHGRDTAVATIDARVGLDAPSGDSSTELDDIACPSVRLCEAVDSQGDVVGFNPRSRRRVASTPIDALAGFTSISCPSRRLCVAADAVGRVFAGRPGATAWTPQVVPGAVFLADVTCRSETECVAVDAAGDAFLARR
jgi:hypothetical protein